MPYPGRPSPPNGPGLYRTPAFIMLLAALYLSSRCRRGLRFAPSRRLRWIDCGAITTIPGGACTSRYSYNSLRARHTGFSHRVGAPTGTPRGSGPSLCPGPMMGGDA